MKLNTKGKIASLFSLAVLVASVFLGSGQAYAASAGLSVSKTSVGVNEEFVVSVGITDAASWDIHVTSTGPAASCAIDQTGATEPGETGPETELTTNATSSPVFSVTCTATEAGEVGLTLSGTIVDGEEVRTEISGSASVTATAPVSPEPKPGPEPEPQPTPPHDDPEPTPDPTDDGGEDENEDPSVPGVIWPVPSTTNPETPSAEATSEASEAEEAAEPSDTAEEKENGNKDTKDEDKEQVLAISGSSDDNVKKTLVIVLAVVATIIGLLEAFLILSSRRKERLQTLREKAQALQVVTTTMQLAQALDKKA